MNNDTTTGPQIPEDSPQDVLTEVLRNGAREMLSQAINAEVAEYVAAHGHERDAAGHRLVVRNGYAAERELQTGLGAIPVKQPRVNDRRVDEDGQRLRFTSKILPPYLRKTKSIEELIPWLYLRGISSGDFSQALSALLGPDAPGLSASTVVRLKQIWQQDQEAWSKRSLADRRYVYWWVDGIYFNIRLEEDRQCILVIMGATPEGRKELVAIHDGFRESEQSWTEVLLDLKARGLQAGPQLAVGDGALGFWKALRKVYGQTREQRCWVHKTGNVLNKLPKSKHGKAKGMLHDIWMAETRQDANRAFDLFVESYQAKYSEAVKCLTKDRDVLLAFYDFPAEHWMHLRTTNPIESTFATVRLRTRRTKGSGSRAACLAMVFKLTMCAAKTWRALNGSPLLADVIRGVQFVDGLKKEAA
ncbi:MAG: IS256 family transposase [Xanthomonadales bacterium]|nr:IS256 family transposase [Xanthomonadales bacterium]NIX12588.1 IS256 family transposase [Xanthomonadales bacterium]